MDPFVTGGLIALFGLVIAGTYDQSCTPPGTWWDPATGKEVAADAVIGQAASASVVLLGERHDAAAHHRWQLDVLTDLHARKAHMALGFESFPRRVQPILDTWVSGALSEQAFLEKVVWKDVWGFDPELYMPLFRFARDNGLPMVALNVERSLVRRTGKEGWASVPHDEREEMGDPARASAAYQSRLEAVLSAHAHGAGDPNIDQAAKRNRFVEAQLVWDRAMAEALAQAWKADTQRLVVGIVGQGHVDYGYGIPHQLADLGVRDVRVLLPWDKGEACAEPDEGGVFIADAVYTVDQSAD